MRTFTGKLRIIQYSVLYEVSGRHTEQPVTNETFKPPFYPLLINHQQFISIYFDRLPLS